MGKKIVKFPSMFKKVSNNDQCQWPSSCNNPTTYSFRAGYENNDDMMFKTVNSIFLDPCYIDQTSPDKPYYTNSSEYHSSSLSNTTSTDQLEDQNTADDDQLEQIIRGVRSDRLFFEPCNSILSSTTTSAQVFENVGDSTHHDTRDENFEDLPFKESVVLAMESEDPYEDFKGSMMEMVESHGIKDWECLEELLEWYLKMNGKMNHEIIVQAFVDLLVGLASSDDSTSFSSAASTFSSSPTSSTTSRREFDHQDHM